MGRWTPPLALLFLALACTPPDGGGKPRRPVSSPPAHAAAAAAAPPGRGGLPRPGEADPPPAEEPAAMEPSELYDLGADLETRRLEAVEELGARARTEIVEDVFLLVVPPGQSGLANAAGVAAQALEAYFNDRFERRPERAISVYLFPSAPAYGAYCEQRWNRPCGSIYGFYRPDERRIVMNVQLGVGTLTHELVHPIIDADFPDAPIWIDEGIASLFEGFSLPAPGQIRGVKNWRHRRLVQALASPDERAAAAPSTLFGMSDAVFRGPLEDLHYATARYLCLWLDQRGQLWSFYHRWRDGRSADPTGALAFTSTVGATPTEVDEEWARWVRRL